MARIKLINNLAVLYFVILVDTVLSQASEKATDQKRSIPRTQSEWFDLGLLELGDALNVKLNSNQAKNVVIFIGDGMGPNTVTAARILDKGEAGRFKWEEFPHKGLLKTYSVNEQVADSAATATALFGGVKTNSQLLGLDASVTQSNCIASFDKARHVLSILELAQEAGLSTGFVTNTRVMHATPAALYAHSPDRRWECEARMPDIAKRLGCKDLARILIEDKPGKDINVIMGGGRQCLVSNITGTVDDPINTWACFSTDGRDLIRDWNSDKSQRGLRHKSISNTQQLRDIPSNDVDYILGVFANGHMPYEHERNTSPTGMPSLAEMTEKAIQILSKNQKGFLLMVESGMIDQAHHRGWAHRALSETVALNDAVEATIKSLGNKLDETLVIVTSDHAHTLSINGYPETGNDILGVAQRSLHDNVPYTTLTYATGGPAGFQVGIENGQVRRRDPTLDDIRAYDYVQQVGILSDENTHGGSDVAVHAIGPMSHLFHRVHEQSYVAHAISYAARLGRFGTWY